MRDFILNRIAWKLCPPRASSRQPQWYSMWGFCVVWLCLLPSHVLSEESLDPAQPYFASMGKPVTHDVELVVTVTAPYKTRSLRVWMPVPPDDATQKLLHSQFETFPVEVSPVIDQESVFGNRFAYFEFSAPQGAIIIRHQLKIRVHELHWNLDPSKLQVPEAWPESFAPYLCSEEQAVVVDKRLKNLLEGIVPQRQNPLANLTAVMSYVDQNFKYDHSNASLKASSLHAFDQQAGHCSDYHGFCAAMGRLMQQPTRVTYGINTFPKASPSHCKLEAFLAPYGWVSFDVSETQKMTALIRGDTTLSEAEQKELIAAAYARLASGFRDNTWFKQTQGTDYELAPRAARKVAVVRTIYAEADGVALSEPDPSDPNETKFSWMTSQKFVSKPEVSHPFTDVRSLRQTCASSGNGSP